MQDTKVLAVCEVILGDLCAILIGYALVPELVGEDLAFHLALSQHYAVPLAVFGAQLVVQVGQEAVATDHIHVRTLAGQDGDSRVSHSVDLADLILGSAHPAKHLIRQHLVGLGAAVLRTFAPFASRFS